MERGKNAAVASMVCGVLAIVWRAALSGILPVILGIIGVFLSANAKKMGYEGELRIAGFILSTIGVILGAINIVACVACAGCAIAML